MTPVTASCIVWVSVAVKTTIKPANTMQITITLRAYGNPDFRQYADIAPARLARVNSLSDAVKAARDYISSHNLGGGNWGAKSGVVFSGKKAIARVSYNGRLWDMSGEEIPQAGVKTAKQCEDDGWR